MGKVFRNGNSLAVTVPKAFAHQLSIRDGSKIQWAQKNNGLLLLKTEKIAKTHSVDKKFAQMVDEFINDHEDALQELSSR